jgi:hypothetical protein
MSNIRSRTAIAAAARNMGTAQMGEPSTGSHGPLIAAEGGYTQGLILGLPRYTIMGRDRKAKAVARASFLTMYRH